MSDDNIGNISVSIDASLVKLTKVKGKSTSF